MNLSLDKFLEAKGLSRYQLAKELDNFAVGRSTAYAVAAGHNQPTLKTLGAVIAALRNLTGEPVDFSDILEYVEDDQGEERRSHDPGTGRPAARAKWLADEEARKARAKGAPEEQ